MSTGPRRTIFHSEAFDLGSARLALDESGAIYLVGTGSAVSVLPTIPSAVLIEKHPFREVRRHPIEGRDHRPVLASLQRNGFLETPNAISSRATFRCRFPADDPVGRVHMGQCRVFTPEPPARSTAGRWEHSAR